MNKNLDIIILALSRWDGPYSSTAFSMAKELAKTNRVFYIDNPFTYKDLFLEFNDRQIQRRLPAFLTRRNVYNDLSTAGQKLVAITTPLALPINFLPEGKMYDLLSRINDWFFLRAVRSMMKKYSITDFIFLNVFNPFYAQEFPDFFKPKLYVYYTNDDIANSLYVKKHGVRLESRAFEKAALTLATSQELKKIASRCAENVHYLPNGVDHSLFSKNNFKPPPELQSIKTPIIVFTGNCDHRINFDLVKMILTKHADKTLVMIGPIQEDEEIINEVKRFPNILFLGRRDLAELPQYLHFAHCSIIPYKCNALTRSIYPLKLNEYLASGIPVVATPFSEDIKSFNGKVLFGEDHEDFCEKISEAITKDTVEKKKERIDYAMKNNWQNRVNEFWDVIQHHMAERYSN